jgi:conjugal transfer ATP-binding protein TraC
LAIDEAWSIMDNKIVVRFLETMARRVRKYNGASGIITQTIGDFYKNKATRAIFDSSAWKLFLQQSKESIQAASNKGELTLDEGLLALLQTVKTKTPYFSEILVKQDSGAYFIGRLITDPVAHWIYTNHPKDMQIIYSIMEKFGISKLDAKLIKGYSTKNKSPIEEEYKIRLSNGKLLKRVV